MLQGPPRPSQEPVNSSAHASNHIHGTVQSQTGTFTDR